MKKNSPGRFSGIPKRYEKEPGGIPKRTPREAGERWDDAKDIKKNRKRYEKELPGVTETTQGTLFDDFSQKMGAAFGRAPEGGGGFAAAPPCGGHQAVRTMASPPFFPPGIPIFAKIRWWPFACRWFAVGCRWFAVGTGF